MLRTPIILLWHHNVKPSLRSNVYPIIGLSGKWKVIQLDFLAVVFACNRLSDEIIKKSTKCDETIDFHSLN